MGRASRRAARRPRGPDLRLRRRTTRWRRSAVARAAGTRTATPSATFATATGYKIDSTWVTPTARRSARCTSRGPGSRMWGAAMGVDWKPRPTRRRRRLRRQDDVRRQHLHGVAFWAKASAPLDGVQVSFPDLYTDDAAPPHDMPDPSIRRCQRVHGLRLPSTRPGSWQQLQPVPGAVRQEGRRGGGRGVLGVLDVQIDTTWKRFEVLFVDTRQDPGNRRLPHARPTS